MSGNGGVGGMPGVKKNKDMNKYASGGPVETRQIRIPKMQVRGAGAATKGISFNPGDQTS